MATTEERLAALEAKLAQLTATTPTTYYTHQYSGEEIDAAVGRAVSGGALDTSVSNVSKELGTFVRPNIFDNPDYCINQRGTTEIASDAGYYTDRWRKYGLAATGTVERGLVHIITDGSTTCGWVQRFEASRLIAGETYTFSVFFKLAKASDVKMSYGDKLDSLSDTKVIADGNTPLDTWDLATFTFTLPQSGDGNYNFRVRSAAVAGEYYIGPAKLELGDTQTLAHQDSAGNWVLNEIPDYGEQLRRCQRYAVECAPSGYNIDAQIVGIGSAETTSIAHIVIPTPTTMRALPIIVWSNLILRQGAQYFAPTTISVWRVSAIGVTVLVTCAGLTVGAPCELRTDNTNGKALLSADL